MEREQSSGGTILIVLALVFAILIAMQNMPHIGLLNSSDCSKQPSAEQWQQMSQADRFAFGLCASNSVLNQQENKTK